MTDIIERAREINVDPRQNLAIDLEDQGLVRTSANTRANQNVIRQARHLAVHQIQAVLKKADRNQKHCLRRRTRAMEMMLHIK